jgi:ribosomal protein S12 methylthiotransferase accessory factor
VERDATSLWHQTSDSARARTRLDLATVGDDACRETFGKLDAAGLAVAVWETTTDIGVPAFYCMVTDQRNATAHPGAGAGCHPAPEVALLRAVTEAVQVRTTYIAGSRDDLSPTEYRPAAIAKKLQRALKLMAPDRPARRFGQDTGARNESFEKDVTWLLTRLRSVGVKQVVAVDLSKPEFGIPVVRIVIPGLEGPDDHDDYLPGLRARALSEARP